MFARIHFVGAFLVNLISDAVKPDMPCGLKYWTTLKMEIGSASKS